MELSRGEDVPTSMWKHQESFFFTYYGTKRALNAASLSVAVV